MRFSSEVAFHFPDLFEVESQNRNVCSRDVHPATFPLCKIASDRGCTADAKGNYLTLHPTNL